MSNMEEGKRHEMNDDGASSGPEREDFPSDHDEAKVIRKGAARLIVSGAEPIPPVNKKPQEIRPEPRVHISVEEEPIIDAYEESEGKPEEEVWRLERSIDPGKERIKVDRVKFEKLEAKPDEAERQEAQWGRNTLSGGRMLLIGGAAVILLVVILVELRGFFDGDSVKAEVTSPLIVIEEETDIYEGSPEKWFRERPGRKGVEALFVMKSFLAAPDDLSQSKWVRNPEAFLRHVKKWPAKIEPLIKPDDLQRWDFGHTGNTGYLVLKCRNREYLPLRAYFTREGEEFKLDWHATVAWSDVSLQAIRESALKRSGPANDIQRKAGVVALSELSPSAKSHLPDAIHTDSVLVRCMISKRNEFYAGPYNDQDHSAFTLLSADKMHHMEGYALKGSALDLELRSLLDHGRFVVGLKKDQRVTLRVRVNEKDALPSQLEMVELVHLEWVTPD